MKYTATLHSGVCYRGALPPYDGFNPGEPEPEKARRNSQ